MYEAKHERGERETEKGRERESRKENEREGLCSREVSRYKGA